MRINVLTVVVVVAWYLCASCSSKDRNPDSMDEDITSETVVDSTTTVKDTISTVGERQIFAFLEMLYKEYVFGDGDMATLNSNFSQNVLTRMRDAYSYDCESGDCLASWVFRSGEQDGISDIQEVESITYQPDGKYCVIYNDMGHRGKCIFSIELIDNKVIVKDYERIK